jgi:hypothetical protein
MALAMAQSPAVLDGFMGLSRILTRWQIISQGTNAPLIFGGMAFQRDGRKFVRNSSNCRLSAKKVQNLVTESSERS